MKRLADIPANRIMICGPAGSGKSTLARKISRRRQLPRIHLDALYFEPNWTVTDPLMFRDRVAKVVATDRWVIDGNYSETFDLRCARAELLIFLDLARGVCFPRVVRRTVTHYRRQRPDMAEGCAERFDGAFLKWVWNWFEDRRPEMVERVSQFGTTGEVAWLRTKSDIDDFMT